MTAHSNKNKWWLGTPLSVSTVAATGLGHRTPVAPGDGGGQCHWPTADWSFSRKVDGHPAAIPGLTGCRTRARPGLGAHHDHRRLAADVGRVERAVVSASQSHNCAC